ncbi:hypothetical protein DCAR_0522493 [Daucus carota subsp. sativus]|uniref:O-fucosyltransferase family protein n=2 Tax=Daucus carota subsp. sativus TaxID=79200 RepID=A0A164ZUJ0_DAUCS|nr:PREDICTED: uncharacterized protein LOC108220678 [Daucus carota subsp. sativus]WOH03101.1 hypothetical protein DCAR_0522493 [Daucus carota subsp. sativus]
MLNRPALSRTGSFRAENLGQTALALISNLCFTMFVLVVLIFTVIAATYKPEDPLFHPSSRITMFLTSDSNATFVADSTVVRTGEDFMAVNQSAFGGFINVTDVDLGVPLRVDVNADEVTAFECEGQIGAPVDCSDPGVFHLMMTSAIEQFRDIHFYRFGKPVRGDNDSSCHMAWRFRPKEGKAAAFYKDYRSFVIDRSGNCTLSVVGIGEYHSGGNARKRKKNLRPGFEKPQADQEQRAVVPVVGEVVSDALPAIESEGSFSSGKYLFYTGGGERCKSMDHFLWSFTCALGEAKYLNRTLVMDMSICLSSVYTSSGQDEEGKDFRYYFDFEHLKDSTSVLDQTQFWVDWNKWNQKDGLALLPVDDFKITPMKLAGAQETLIMRKFGAVEPDNYWYRVCEGDAESVIQRPWHMIWKSRRLMEIVSAIAAKLNWDFDSVHVVRGEKARNLELWPNLAADTSPEALISTLQDKVDAGRSLYIATDESDTTFFDPLKDKFATHFLDEYKDLWDENSEWYSETMKLNNGVPVEFDGYMRASVDTEVFLRGKRQIETFNDLTRDCKDGVNTCTSSS